MCTNIIIGTQVEIFSKKKKKTVRARTKVSWYSKSGTLNYLNTPNVIPVLKSLLDSVISV